MSSNDLIPMINCLREEIKNYYSLVKKNFYEKIPQKKEIRKIDIKESKNKIELLNKIINEKIIDRYMKILKLKKEITKEKEIKNKLERKNKKIDDFINKGKKILINGLPYFEKLPEYSNKKLKIAKLSPLDLINLTLRLSQQNKAPPGAYNYLNSMIATGLMDDNKNEFNLFYYYIKNKNRYLYPCPSPFDLQNSILRYDFSEENRLKPPILVNPKPELDSEGNIIANKGTLIKLKYPSENSKDIYFKYSKDINIAPSSFSGEEYKDFSRPDLDKDCIFKVCTCKKGFKDSKIITFKFVINKDKEELLTQKEAQTKAKIDRIGKERNKIENVDRNLQFGSLQSIGSNNSPHNFVDQGTSNYQNVYLNPEDINDDDEDEFSI